MKKIIAIILCLMVLMLSACGKQSDETTPSTDPAESTEPSVAETLPAPTEEIPDDDFQPDTGNIVGTWETTMDYAGLLNVMMRSDPDMGEYFNFSEIIIRLVFQFDEDGTYSLSVDPASAESIYQDVVTQMLTGLKSYFIDNNVDFDELLQEAGTTEEALAESVLSKDSLLNSLLDLEATGTYSLVGETLTRDDEIYSCQFASENELTLDIAAEPGALDFMFPMTLTRT